MTIPCRALSGINLTCKGFGILLPSTPLQRPERFGTREFLTPEEVEADLIRQQEALEAANAREAELVVNPQAPTAGGSGRIQQFLDGRCWCWRERKNIANRPSA